MKKSTPTKPTPEVIVIRQGGERREKIDLSPERERFQRKRREIAKTLPCASELAALAATLEQGKPISVVGARESARNALMLWETCYRHLETEIDTQTKDAISNEDELELSGRIARPARFPASFADFERLVIPGKTETERRATYREFLREHLAANRHLNENASDNVAPKATWDEVNAEIARNTSEPFSEHFYFHRARQFLKWKKGHDKKMRSVRASAGGAAMKEKAAANKAEAEV